MSEIHDDQSAPPVSKHAKALLLDLEDQIDNLRQRIKLSEAEWRAEREEREDKVRQNKNQINCLRHEIRDLQIRMCKAKLGDEKVIKKAFRKHSQEMGVMKGRSGKDAVEILEGKAFDLSKKRDSILHEIKMKEKILMDTQQQYQEMALKCSQAIANEPSESDSAQRVRELENEYQKVQMKINEAEHIQRKYKTIQQLLVEELVTLPSKLDELENQFKLQQADIDNLIATGEKANETQAKTRIELGNVEGEAVKARQEKDRVVTEFSQVIEQRRTQQFDPEANRKRALSVLPDTPSMAEKLKSMQVDQEKELKFFNQAFDQIKEVTGVTDIQDAEARFIAQNTIQENLQDLKQRAENTLQDLKEEKRRLESQLETMKGAELACPQVALQEEIKKLKKVLQEQEKRKAVAQVELDQVTQLLADIKTGLWHQLQLMEYHLLENEEVKCPPSDIPVTELSEKVEEMIEKLMSSFQDKDIEQLKQQIKEEAFLQKLEEEKLAEPAPPPPRQKPAAEEESSSEDESQKRSKLKKEAIIFAEQKRKQKGRGKGFLLK